MLTDSDELLLHHLSLLPAVAHGLSSGILESHNNISKSLLASTIGLNSDTYGYKTSHSNIIFRYFITILPPFH